MNRCCHSVGFWGDSSESKALNTPKMLRARHDEVAKAGLGVWCLGWVGYMVTCDCVNWKSETVTPQWCSKTCLWVGTISSVPYSIQNCWWDTDGYVFRTGDVALYCYYDDNLDLSKLERLHWDNTRLNQSPKGERNKEPPLLFLFLLFLI